MRNFFVIFFLLDSIVVGFFIVMGKYLALLNVQVGSISALFVAMASFYTFKKNINHGAKDLENTILEDEQDELDKIDDPYELYDNSDINQKELTKEEIQAIIQEERKKQKQQPFFKGAFQNYKAIFSPVRLVAYLVLIMGFLWLNKNSYLDIFAYIIGLTVLPLASFVYSFTTTQHSNSNKNTNPTAK